MIKVKLLLTLIQCLGLTCRISKVQLVFRFLVSNFKPRIFSVQSVSRNQKLLIVYPKNYSKPVFCLILSQAADLLQSKPIFTNEEITEAMFVVIPGAVKINGAIQSLLDHCPSSTSCRLVAIYIKGSFVIRVDCINTADSLIRVVKLSTVLSF